MRFLYSDPYTLRTAVEQLAGQPAATRRERDQAIPVDVYQDGNDVVIEGALPGARLEDLELSCDDGLMTVRGTVSAIDRDYAVREIPRGAFSRTLALPTDCDVTQAKASFDGGIIRIVLPRRRQQTSHTIKVEVAKADESSRIVMEKPPVIDAIKGKDFREVQTRSGKPRSRTR